MKDAGAALWHHADLTAGGPAILGRIAGGEHLYLRCGVHVSDTDAGSIGTCAHHGCTVQRDQAFLAARTADIEWIIQAEAEVCHRRVTYHARFHLGEVYGVAAVELDALDLLLGDELADHGTLSLYVVDTGLHRDRGTRVANLHRDVDPAPNGGVHLHVVQRRGLKTRGFHSHRVVARSHVRNREVTTIVGGNGESFLGRAVANGYLGIWQQRA